MPPKRPDAQTAWLDEQTARLFEAKAIDNYADQVRAVWAEFEIAFPPAAPSKGMVDDLRAEGKSEADINKHFADKRHKVWSILSACSSYSP
jgi:hypothetical protein